jgi:hypothetical protein
MDCGADQYACQLMAWVSENQFAAAVFSKLIAHVGHHAAGVIRWITDIIEFHGDKLIAGAVFVFGVYKWLINREGILHKRLDEYLHDSDARLLNGQEYVLEGINRPRPGQTPKAPLFASRELQAVLKERRWDIALVAANVAQSSESLLRIAAEKIENQLETAEKTIESLREQLATTHILRGAIASSTPIRSWRDPTERNNFALNSFRSALQIPGQEANVIAKELEAHQLRKMGQLSQALTAYEEMGVEAENITDFRKQVLCIARSKRYRAEILQSMARIVDADGITRFGGVAKAHDLLKPNLVGSALQLRMQFLPFQGWDLLEQGDIHYLAAFVAKNLGFGAIQATRLTDAETAYQNLLQTIDGRKLLMGNAKKKLRHQAQIALMRVSKAHDGVYEYDWLA